jgi:ribosomal protein S21
MKVFQQKDRNAPKKKSDVKGPLKLKGIEVEVKEFRDMDSHKEDVTRAIAEFSKQTKRSGLMNELRAREAYVKPSVKARLKRETAIRKQKYNLA